MEPVSAFVYSSLQLNDSNTTVVPPAETGGIFPCSGSWLQSQHLLFQLANSLFCLAYLAPNRKCGALFMHGVLIIAFLVFSTWAWNVICAPDVFSWNFTLTIVNMGQTLYVLYTMRSVKFPKELEDIYVSLFQPLQVSRLVFKKLTSSEYAQMVSLHAGEAYAMQNLTKTDRLGLLVSGKVNVLTDHHFLHHIFPKQFLDSPEFESSKPGHDDKFKVSIIAATNCQYMVWQRETLEYLLIKESFLASILSLIIARDITNKLYAMNDKIVTEHGSHLDIRLPSITGSITSQAGVQGEWQSPVCPPSRALRSKSLQYSGAFFPGGYHQNNAYGLGHKDKDQTLLGSREELMGSSPDKSGRKSREALDVIGSLLMTIFQTEDDLD